MKVETFFQEFEGLAEVPGAPDRLRELVLDLAIRGRLLSQCSADEPSWTTLQRARARLTKRIRDAEQRLVGEEVPFPIPASWCWVRMATATEKITDGTHHSPPNGASGEFKYVTAKNIKNEGIRLEGITYVSRRVHEEIYARCDPRRGDVLYIKDGATTGIAAINNLAEPFSMLSSVALLRPTAAVDNRYLLWAMRSPFFYSETRNAMKGAAITRVTLAVLGSSVIPLPPLAEQKRIVAKVDELMALCDRLEAQQQERETRHVALSSAALARFSESPTPANLQLLFHKSYDIDPAQLRRALLDSAVRGGLVAQIERDESVETTIRLSREKAGLPPAGLPQPKSDRVPFAIPETWRWVAVDSVAQARLGKMLDKAKGRGQPHPYLRNTNVHWFRFELASIKVMLFQAAELQEYALEPGDIMICEGGHGIARAAVWRGEVPGMKFQKALHRVRPLSCLESDYFTYFLWVSERNGWLQSFYTGAGIPHFTGRSLARLLIPLPPLAEQGRIVAKVNQLMVLIDGLEARLVASRANGEKLLDAVVAELTQAIPAA